MTRARKVRLQREQRKARFELSIEATLIVLGGLVLLATGFGMVSLYAPYGWG